jgi:hypothetical protein
MVAAVAVAVERDTLAAGAAAVDGSMFAAVEAVLRSFGSVAALAAAAAAADGDVAAAASGEGEEPEKEHDDSAEEAAVRTSAARTPVALQPPAGTTAASAVAAEDRAEAAAEAEQPQKQTGEAPLADCSSYAVSDAQGFHKNNVLMIIMVTSKSRELERCDRSTNATVAR